MIEKSNKIENGTSEQIAVREAATAAEQIFDIATQALAAIRSATDSDARSRSRTETIVMAALTSRLQTIVEEADQLRSYKTNIVK